MCARGGFVGADDSCRTARFRGRRRRRCRRGSRLLSLRSADPPETRHYVRIDGRERRMCCVGCEAVAQSIVDNGLVDYYRHRDAMPETRREAMPVELQGSASSITRLPEELRAPGRRARARSRVDPRGHHLRRLRVAPTRTTSPACPACRRSRSTTPPGVRACAGTSAGSLSDILAAIQAIGYRAYPTTPSVPSSSRHRERRSMLWRVFVAGFGMMQVMMYAFLSRWPARARHDLGHRACCAGQPAADAPVVLYSAAPFFQRAWRDLRLRRLGMDVPVALGVGSAFAASLWATLTDGPEVYFDSVTMFVFFLLGGRYLEMIARQKAVRGRELGKALPRSPSASPAGRGVRRRTRCRPRSWWRGRAACAPGRGDPGRWSGGRGSRRGQRGAADRREHAGPQGGRRSCHRRQYQRILAAAGARRAGRRRHSAGGDPSPHGTRSDRSRASPVFGPHRRLLHRHLAGWPRGPGWPGI